MRTFIPKVLAEGQGSIYEQTNLGEQGIGYFVQVGEVIYWAYLFENFMNGSLSAGFRVIQNIKSEHSRLLESDRIKICEYDGQLMVYLNDKIILAVEPDDEEGFCLFDLKGISMKQCETLRRFDSHVC